FKTLMTQSEMLQPFGYIFSKGSFQTDARLTHDLFTETILLLGYVPVTFILILGGAAIYKAHTLLFKIRAAVCRKFYLLSLSCFVGILASGLANQSALETFPINFYFWLLASFMAAEWYSQGRDKLSNAVYVISKDGNDSPGIRDESRVPG
ncbi:MAG: hypothetical protein KDN22_21005, partial [Verrucomicrobiae bacterium]|nr:hypothetical protein [Verrucomicrobiae bacterium]